MGLLDLDEAVRVLAAHGADVNRYTAHPDPWTPLTMAAMAGREAVVAVLLEAGADIGRGKQKSGKTALAIAVEQGHDGVARLLREAGAEA